jgi:23S rRNA pseudouridine2605 synthase
VEKIRIQKYFTDCGVLSRRAAEAEIAAGRVQVNGTTATIGQKIDPDIDVVTYLGKQIRPLPPADHVTIMLHKPVGFVTTTSDEEGRPCVTALVEDLGVRVYPVGRLDMFSTGLLLLTNDGDFANELMHPKHQVEKTYEIWVTGYSAGGFRRLKEPMELNGYQLRTPKLKLLKAEGSYAHLEITIHEGRNRQVRRMCEIAGMHVTRLRRIREGSLSLGDLPKGKWRYLTLEEISKMK